MKKDPNETPSERRTREYMMAVESQMDDFFNFFFATIFPFIVLFFIFV